MPTDLRADHDSMTLIVCLKQVSSFFFWDNFVFSSKVRGPSYTQFPWAWKRWARAFPKSSLIKHVSQPSEVLCVPFSERMPHLNLDRVHEGDACCSPPRSSQKVPMDNGLSQAFCLGILCPDTLHPITSPSDRGQCPAINLFVECGNEVYKSLLIHPIWAYR